jgi:hypothetical protein
MKIAVLAASLLLFQAQQRDFKPVANVNQLMNALIIPSSNALFNVGLEEPEGDDGWSEVRNQAVVLAESGNLLLMRSEGREGWITASQTMIAAGEASLAAAEARDVDELLLIGDQILESCQSCHDQYWN